MVYSIIKTNRNLSMCVLFINKNIRILVVYSIIKTNTNLSMCVPYINKNIRILVVYSILNNKYKSEYVCAVHK